jgi:hypothetical protein
MKKILTLKHWQLFLVSITGYLILPSPFEEITGLISLGVLTVWEYSIGYYGEQRLRLMGLPRKNLSLYQVNTLFLLVVGTCVIFLSSYMENNFQGINYPEEWVITFVMLAIYLIYAAIQILVFNARTITELESREPAGFNDFFSNLLLFLFFPIGVWFLVPKVKKQLVDEYDEANLFESI